MIDVARFYVSKNLGNGIRVGQSINVDGCFVGIFALCWYIIKYSALLMYYVAIFPLIWLCKLIIRGLKKVIRSEEFQRKSADLGQKCEDKLKDFKEFVGTNSSEKLANIKAGINAKREERATRAIADGSREADPERIKKPWYAQIWFRIICGLFWPAILIPLIWWKYKDWKLSRKIIISVICAGWALLLFTAQPAEEAAPQPESQTPAIIAELSSSNASSTDVQRTVPLETTTETTITTTTTTTTTETTTATTTTATAPTTTTEHKEMVWVSGTGKRYHSNRYCSNMAAPKEITKEEAEERGLTPCKNCY